MRWVLPLGFAIVAIVSACRGDDSNPPSASVSPTSTQSARASHTPAASLTASPFGTLITRGPDIDLPDDLALIIESGCFGCDGGPGPLWRVYRDAAGIVRTENVFAAIGTMYPERTNGSGEQFPVGPTSHAATQDASVIAVAACLKGACEPGGLFSWDPDSEAAILRSVDGGVTWTEIARGGPVYTVEGVFADGRVLIYNATEEAGEPTYSILPDNTIVEPPPDGVYPITVSNEMLWGTNDGRLLLSDGSLAFAPPNSYVYYRSVVGQFSDGQTGKALVFWDIPVPTPQPDNYVIRYAISSLDFSGGSAVVNRQWEIEGYLGSIGSWSADENLAVISIVPADPSHFYQSPLPAVVDLNTGMYYPIPGPFFGERPDFSSLGRTYVRAVQTGPFARVTGTGSCLNIRTDPSESAQALTCMADGVLLRDTGQTNGEWVAVMTPGGTQGWASVAFLER